MTGFSLSRTMLTGLVDSLVIRIPLLILLATAGGWLLGFAAFALAVKTIEAPSPAIRTDAIVVLTGGPARLRTALELWADGAAPDILVSGAAASVSSSDIRALMPRDLRRRLPACCLDVESVSGTTAENATQTKKWIEKRGVRSLRLVTAGYHMPRAYLEMRLLLPGTAILAHPAASDTPESEGMMRLRIKEYHKTLVTLLRWATGQWQKAQAT